MARLFFSFVFLLVTLLAPQLCSARPNGEGDLARALANNFNGVNRDAGSINDQAAQAVSIFFIILGLAISPLIGILDSQVPMCI